MKINPQIVFQEEIDGSGILFDPNTGRAFGLNPTATLIWKSLAGGAERHGILQELACRTDAPPEVAADLDTFLEQLTEHGFLAS